MKNSDFSKGERSWKTSGKIDPAEGETPALLVELNDRKWSMVEQQLRFDRDELPANVSLEVELKASADFAPEAESNKYSDVDFKMGGNYGWSARVFPKADLLIQVANGGGWEYRPRKLKRGGDWQTIRVKLDKIKIRKAMLTLAFPPGTGSVTLRLVSAQRN